MRFLGERQKRFSLENGKKLFKLIALPFHSVLGIVWGAQCNCWVTVGRGSLKLMIQFAFPQPTPKARLKRLIITMTEAFSLTIHFHHAVADSSERNSQTHPRRLFADQPHSFHTVHLSFRWWSIRPDMPHKVRINFITAAICDERLQEGERKRKRQKVWRINWFGCSRRDWREKTEFSIYFPELPFDSLTFIFTHQSSQQLN